MDNLRQEIENYIPFKYFINIILICAFLALDTVSAIIFKEIYIYKVIYNKDFFIILVITMF